MKKILLTSFSAVLLFSACGEKSNVSVKGRLAAPGNGPQPSDKKTATTDSQNPNFQQKTIDQIKITAVQQQVKTVVVEKKGIQANIICANQLSTPPAEANRLNLRLLGGSQIVIGQDNRLEKPKIRNQDRRVPLLIPNEILHILCTNNEKFSRKRELSDISLLTGGDPQGYPIKLKAGEANAFQEIQTIRIGCVTELEIAGAGSDLFQYQERGADLILSAGSIVSLETSQASSIVTCEHGPDPKVPEELDTPISK